MLSVTPPANTLVEPLLCLEELHQVGENYPDYVIQPRGTVPLVFLSVFGHSGEPDSPRGVDAPEDDQRGGTMEEEIQNVF